MAPAKLMKDPSPLDAISRTSLKPSLIWAQTLFFLVSVGFVLWALV